MPFTNPDINLSTLNDIRIMIRRICRLPGTQNITDAELDSYINTFVLYDLPQNLRLKVLKTNMSFYTNPYVDIYENNDTDPTNPLYNFKNRIITVLAPLYVAGFPVYFTQSYEQFFAIYPKINAIVVIGKGNNVQTNYFGTLRNGFPVLRNEVTISSADTNNAALTLVDTPYNATIGYMEPPGTAINFAIPPAANRMVNYVTGAYNVTFTVAPGTNKDVVTNSVPVITARPQSVLFWNNKFIVRPVPDRVYKVDFCAFYRPTELLTSGQMPELADWFQYIAYGAAKKIFESRMDMDSVAAIMPEFKNQERLVLRKTNAQQGQQRIQTIYSDNGGVGFNNGGFGPGGFGWGPW